MDDHVTLSVRLPPEVAELLKLQADKDRRSVNSTIIVAVERFLAEKAAA